MDPSVKPASVLVSLICCRDVKSSGSDLIGSSTLYNIAANAAATGTHDKTESRLINTLRWRYINSTLTLCFGECVSADNSLMGLSLFAKL